MGGPIYSLVRLTFNTLYPAYSSFKAVKSKNVREYVKWMMYWIVFAFFSALETLVDPFIFWFPFYSEIKIILLLYLVSPMTRGSGVVYRRFLHPLLCYREDEIDAVLSRAQDQGYQTLSAYTSRAVSWVASTMITTAVRGGGTVLQQIKRSYSMLEISDLAELAFRDEHRFEDVTQESNSGGSPPSSSKLRRREMRKNDLNPSNRRSLMMSSDMMGSTESLSSGYNSDFLPVNTETMDTQDYELWERGKQVRYTPKLSRRNQAQRVQEVMSEDEEYQYRAMPTPFGPLNRSGPSGMVSPDPCTSYYPSEGESEDEQASSQPNIRTNEQFRPISPKDHLDQPRSAESVRIYDQNRPSDQLVRSSGPTPPRSRAMQQQQGQDQDPRLGVGKELTIEDIQLAARRLNLNLVPSSNTMDDNDKPLPPKRSFKPGPPGEGVFPSGDDAQSVLTNQPCVVSNPSLSKLNLPAHSSSTTSEDLAEPSSLPSQNRRTANETLPQPAPLNQPFSMVQEELHQDPADVAPNVLKEDNQLINQSNSLHLSTAYKNSDNGNIQVDSTLQIPADDLNDVSDSEFFDPEEENEPDNEDAEQFEDTKVEYNVYEEITSQTEIKDMTENEVKPSESSLNTMVTTPLNPFDMEDEEDLSEPSESESSNLLTVVDTNWIEPEAVKCAPAPVILEAASAESPSIEISPVIETEEKPLVTKIQIRSAKKTRAPPPPAEDESLLARTARIKADDFISRMTNKEDTEEGGGKVLYQSPGFTSTKDDFPNRPLSPEARLKHGLAKLTEGTTDLPIKETPVPFQPPPGTRLFTTTHGITKLRTYYPEDEGGAQGPEDQVEEGAAAPRCPHCTIHSWLPHSPSCPKLKKKEKQ